MNLFPFGMSKHVKTPEETFFPAGREITNGTFHGCSRLRCDQTSHEETRRLEGRLIWSNFLLEADHAVIDSFFFFF